MTAPSRLSAAAIIARLDLKPHPEGGHFRETFRDSADGRDGRAASTAIYFLLARGERSHWHRIGAAGSGTITPAVRSRCRSPMTDRPKPFASALILPPVSGRRQWCRPTPGRLPRVSATGPWSAARSPPGSISRQSNSPSRTGAPKVKPG